MKIEIKLDENCSATSIVIITDKMTDEISDLMQRLSDETAQGFVGFSDGTAEFVEPTNIIRIYALAGKVYAVTDKKEYALRLRLYEAEEKLNKKIFVRISNSEIINIKKVKKFDLSLVGTICVSLSNGTITYASRRYVTKIKQILGI